MPKLSAIHVYPVKSAGGPDPGEAAVEPWGLAGDRRWMVIDPAGRFVSQREQPRLALVRATSGPDGSLRLEAPGARPLTVPVPDPFSPTLPVQVWRDKVEVIAAAEEAHAWFGAFLGAQLRLVHLDKPSSRREIDPDYARTGETVSFADGFPLLLTTTASLDALNSLITAEGKPDGDPLPMNRFRPNLVVDGTAPWAEDAWRRVRIGTVCFRVAKPCGRCLITTIDQQTAQRGPEPLRTLGRHRRIGGKLVFGQNLVPEGTGVLRLGDMLTVLE